MLSLLSGKKTYIGFIAFVAYAIAIQFFGVPSDEAVWGIIVAWTGVSGVIHVDKALDK